MSELLSPFPKSVYADMAKIYAIIANPKRLEILDILKNGPARPERLAEIVGVRRANISQHLAILRGFHVVTSQRRGQQVYYRIAHTPAIIELCRIIQS